MASVQSQKPACPVCNQTDKVKTMQAAYDAGIEQCAPPAVPTKNISMIRTIISCIVLVGVCIFLVIVLIGGMEAQLDSTFMIGLVAITFCMIVLALFLSFRAFQRIVKGDNEANLLLPAWEHAMEEWNHYYFCSRDTVVFDPRTEKTVSAEKLSSLRNFDDQRQEKLEAVAQH